MAIVVPSEYGYVLAVATASALQLFWFAHGVNTARKAAGVPYPYLYAEKSEAEKDQAKHLFNCAQRVHQNSLESFPVFSTLLLIGGISHPEVSAGAGAIYLVGRAAYSSGYKTGEPKKRVRGVFGYIGLLTLLYTTGATIHTLLKAL
ncbi:uncharacterized protein BX664DRAFT_357637 [Halteromyces radiatus]|uniref:uncharacterized protein n=1 Tax=Halteromyces radiatus TaxID=101107 RepID=UPI00221E3792|nr:uncharacterized protein BX664DRAFT_357637 [Halteromyces radiatus]KAI8093167.1 hypothetical protein BX664DRAFT_357637 [Halteromyces radiatus]